MAIECELDETIIEYKGKEIPGLILVCGECDHSVTRPGHDTDDNRRLLREQIERTCPERCRVRHVILEPMG